MLPCRLGSLAVSQRRRETQGSSSHHLAAQTGNKKTLHPCEPPLCTPAAGARGGAAARPGQRGGAAGAAAEPGAGGAPGRAAAARIRAGAPARRRGAPPARHGRRQRHAAPGAAPCTPARDSMPQVRGARRQSVNHAKDAVRSCYERLNGSREGTVQGMVAHSRSCAQTDTCTRARARC